MREKSFEERLNALKDAYGGNEFDIVAIIELEDEYTKITKENPEHTKRRQEILDMRHRLLRNLVPKNR